MVEKSDPGCIKYIKPNNNLKYQPMSSLLIHCNQPPLGQEERYQNQAYEDTKFKEPRTGEKEGKTDFECALELSDPVLSPPT